MRHLARQRDVVVDPHAPEPQPVGDAQRPADVAGPDRRRQSVRRAVGPRDGLVLVGEALDGDDRPEDLALDHLVVLPEVGHHRGLEEVARKLRFGPAGHDLGVIGLALEEALDARALLGAVERPEGGVGAHGVAEDVALGLLGQPGDEVVVDLAAREHARRRGAVLPGVVVAGAGDGLQRGLELDVVEHHDRRLSAQLEVHALERVGGRPRHRLAGFHRAGDRDHVDLVVDDQRLARLVAAADHVEHALGQQLRGQLGESHGGHGRSRRRLEHDRVAGRQRRTDLPDGHHQGVVPRRDLAHDAHRLAPDDRGVTLHVLAGGLALHAARRAREEPQVVDHERKLVVLERLDRLARVGGLDLGELVAVLLDGVGEAQQRERALGGSRGRPAVGGRAGGLHGAVDVLGSGRRRLGDLLAGGRVQDGGGLTGCGIDQLTVDEVLQGGGGGGAHGASVYRRGPRGTPSREYW